jgi:small-conductance mechanosensitive channel
MKNLLPILIIGIALVTVIVFLIKNIMTILAVVSFVACIIGFFSLDSLNKIEKQHNIQLVTKKQYKVMLSSLVTPHLPLITICCKMG